MMKHRCRQLAKSFGNHVDPEKAEELKRAKTEIQSNVTRILKLVKNEDQSKRDGITKDSNNKSELVGFIEDFYKQYQSLYALYDHLTGEYKKVGLGRKGRSFSFSSSSSDSEYYSSEEIDSTFGKWENEYHKVLDTTKEDLETNNKEITYRNHRLVSSGEENEVEVINKNLKIKADIREKEHSALVNVHELHGTQESDQITELEKQLTGLKTELESLQSQKGELDVQFESKATEAKQLGEQNICLNARIAELELEAKLLQNQKGEMEENMACKRNEALLQIKGLMNQLSGMQHDLDSLHKQKRQSEEQMERKTEEIFQNLMDIETLKDKLTETTATEQRMLEEKEGFLVKFKGMEQEVDSLCNQKNELEEQLRGKLCETNKLGEENRVLHARNLELEKALTEREAELCALQREYDDLRLEIDRVSRENKQAKGWLKKSKYNLQVSERKMEELVENFRKKLEDSIRLLYQRVRVAEQLHVENKDSYRMTKDKYEENNRILEEKVATYEDEVIKMKDILETAFEVANGLELASEKLGEYKENFVNRLSIMLNEVQFAKDWIEGKNSEMKKLKDNVDCLTTLLDRKEEQEFSLRDKVWKLEAKVSKEGGEKLNLMKTVSQLERRVEKLKNNLKEKEEELSSLGEKKREAIRQLCFLIDYHRSHSDHLKVLISKMTSKNRTST
ncbi:Myosin heavy chain-like protein [Quillaja saponaria]|uniref:Myosin heavy chain-like protein n=1 Tax=Quillaja saponaria TaxID=32244 RepID=A0AAD7KSP8_QUISA|nr:Myosin heavy chain-like protein [Quillaja saponaria]